MYAESDDPNTAPPQAQTYQSEVVKLHITTKIDKNNVNKLRSLITIAARASFLRIAQTWIFFILVGLRTFLATSCQTRRRTRNRITFVLNSHHISFESGLYLLLDLISGCTYIIPNIGIHHSWVDMDGTFVFHHFRAFVLFQRRCLLVSQFRADQLHWQTTSCSMNSAFTRGTVFLM